MPSGVKDKSSSRSSASSRAGKAAPPRARKVAQKAAEGAGESLPVFSFEAVLRQKQLSGEKKRKGERTRDSLKLGAVQALGEMGYHNLRVSDVCDRAGASHAAFYLYFKDKNDITQQVLTDFVDTIAAWGRSGQRGLTVYESCYHTNLAWIRATRANAGLVRCILQLSDDTPEFKKFNDHNGYEWFAHVARTIAKRFLRDPVDERVLLLTVYALGSMMDDLTRRLLVTRDPNLQKLVDGVTPSDEALAEFLSMLWCRALFGTDVQAPRFSAGRQLEKIAAAPSPVADQE